MKKTRYKGDKETKKKKVAWKIRCERKGGRRKTERKRRREKENKIKEKGENEKEKREGIKKGRH
jgi:hypothetical protein